MFNYTLTIRSPDNSIVTRVARCVSDATAKDNVIRTITRAEEGFGISIFLSNGNLLTVQKRDSEVIIWED